MKDTNIINVRFSAEELECLDYLVTQGGYKSRSGCIKSLIAKQMEGIPSPGVKAAVLEIIRNDQDVRTVFQELTQKTIQTAIENMMNMNTGK